MGETLQNNNKEYYKELVRVGLPVTMQQLIMVAVQLCDTIMVGNISEEALAAVGAANQVFFVYIDCMFGFLSGIAVLSVQYWGIRDLAMVRRLMGIGYAMAITLGIPMTIIGYIFTPQLIGIFTDDELVITLGVEYMRVAVFTYLVSTLTFVISYSSRVIAKLKWPTVFNAIAVGVNIILNWCLIYGKLGFPEYGVKGAALATVIARFLEFVLMISYVYISKNHPLSAKINDLKFDFELFRRAFKTAGPVVANEFFWVISFTVTFAIYGKISAAALAVVQIAMTMTDLFMAMYCGVSNTCTVIVGKQLGQGNREQGYKLASKTLKITLMLNIVTTIIFILVRGLIVDIYNYSEETNLLLMQSLLVYAVAITPKMFAYVFICGILRTGGDTVWSAFADAGINWIVQVPIAWISVVILELPLPYCIALVALGDLLKTIICYNRFRSKKWINVFTGR